MRRGRSVGRAGVGGKAGERLSDPAILFPVGFAEGWAITTRKNEAPKLVFSGPMTPEDLKKRFGDDYPAAVTMGAVRMPSKAEGRYTRHHHSEDSKMSFDVSRFMDGSARISADELEREWGGWAYEDQLDFCRSCSWLAGQADFPVMLRFVMMNGGEDDWSGIAGSVARDLPQSEAFDLLVRALELAKDRPVSNLGQAIASTGHVEAPAVLRSLLEKLWGSPGLWDDDDFLNWTAYDATTCIEHLIQVGVPPEEFSAKVRELGQHPCEGNRDSCRRFLTKYYPWME